MKRILLYISLVLVVLGLAGCGGYQTETAGSDDLAPFSPNTQPERWYTLAQVERGDDLYQKHCAECHKPDASGTADWRTLDANGKYPPPPLDGTAHTWHHSISVLRRTVGIGGVPLGGSMPGFAEKLTAEQINDILAWVQTHWSDEIYHIWHERNTQAGNRLRPITKG